MHMTHNYSPEFERAVMSGEVSDLLERMLDGALRTSEAQQNLNVSTLEEEKKAVLQLAIIQVKLHIIVAAYGVASNNWSVNLLEQNYQKFAAADTWRALMAQGAEAIAKMSGVALQIDAWNHLYESSKAMIPFPKEAKPDIEALYKAMQEEQAPLWPHLLDLERKFYPKP